MSDPGLVGDGRSPPPPVEGSAREAIFDAAFGLLSNGLTVAVVEDVHWSDDATLDSLRFLARRLERTSAALLLTYRADEVARKHPLVTFLGELAMVRPVRVPVRVPVQPLTVEGIARLAAGRHATRWNCTRVLAGTPSS